MKLVIGGTVRIPPLVEPTVDAEWLGQVHGPYDRASVLAPGNHFRRNGRWRIFQPIQLASGRAPGGAARRDAGRAEQQGHQAEAEAPEWKHGNHEQSKMTAN